MSKMQTAPTKQPEVSQLTDTKAAWRAGKRRVTDVYEKRMNEQSGLFHGWLTGCFEPFFRTIFLVIGSRAVWKSDSRDW